VFEGHVDPFQHTFFDLTKDAYFGSQEAEKDFSWTRRIFKFAFKFPTEYHFTFNRIGKLLAETRSSRTEHVQNIFEFAKFALRLQYILPHFWQARFYKLI
jgi:hypothetical protein